MNLRLGPLIAGVLSLAVAVAAALVGDAVLPTKWLQDAALVVATMAIAGVALIGLVTRGLAGDAGPPVGRHAQRGVRTPGDEVDDAIDRVGGFARGGYRADLEDRFRDAAVTTLVRRTGVDPSVAQRRLDEGTWTRDAGAVAFFATDAGGPAVGQWLRGLLGGRSRFRRRATVAAGALLRDDDLVIDRATDDAGENRGTDDDRATDDDHTNDERAPDDRSTDSDRGGVA